MAFGVAFDVFQWIASIYIFLAKVVPVFRYLGKYWIGIWRPVDLKKYGEWAIITGGSDGIGKGYALELAKRGLNVCIISRTESKLQNTCKEITSKHPATKTEYICFDFLTGDYSELYQKLSSFEWFNDTGVLVNNVGVLPYGYDCYAKFGVKSSGLSVEETCRKVENLETMNLKSQKVNIHAPSMMTGFLLPVFVQKKKGVIVNLSSVSAVSETPYWTVYGAAKAYNYYFSESIRKELDYDFPEIICQCVQPCVVITNMAPKFVKESIRFPTPETFCNYAVSTIGAVSVTGGYWAHDLLHFLQHIPYYGSSLVRKRFLHIQNSRARKSMKNN